MKVGGKLKKLKDVCDELAGKYPKSFKFTGWHPQCRCTMIPITIDADELVDLTNAQENGEEFVSKNTVRVLPENFIKWYEKNKNRFNESNEPDFLRDNKEIIENSILLFEQQENQIPIEKSIYRQNVEKILGGENSEEVIIKDIENENGEIWKDEDPEVEQKLKPYLKYSGVNTIQTIALKKELSEKEIIDRLGGIETQDAVGSCASLAFAYMANKMGLDVLDHRGGNSKKFFSTYIDSVIKILGGECVQIKEKKEAFSCICNQIVPNEEYILTAGGHATIVKKENNDVYYLELQDNKEDCGFRLLAQIILEARFDLFIGKSSLCLVSRSTLEKNKKSIKDLCSLINTNKKDRKVIAKQNKFKNLIDLIKQ